MKFIKICGIQTADEAIAALSAGANAVGFLVGLTHKADDKIDRGQAAAIVDELPTDANTVLVTHLLDSGRVAELATFIGAKTIQIHGDMALQDIQSLRNSVPGVTLINAVHV